MKKSIKSNESGSGGKYVSGGYLTSTGRLYASKPGPKYSSNNKSTPQSCYDGQYIGNCYLTSTGRIYKSKPGPKFLNPTINDINDSSSFNEGYLTSTGRLYKSKPGPKSKKDLMDSRSLTNVLDNLSIIDNTQNFYSNSYNNDNYNNERQQELIRIRPPNNQVNNFKNRDIYNNINNIVFNNYDDANNYNNLDINDMNKNKIENNNKEKEEINKKIKKYNIRLIISDDYIKIEENKKEKNINDKENEKGDKDEDKRKEDESDFFTDSLNSLSEFSIDSTIIKLKNDLSKNDICNHKNEEKEKSASGNIISLEKYKVKKCIICVKHFNKSEKLGMLKCEHCFHLNCIINWFDLGQKNECPLCKKRQFN